MMAQAIAPVADMLMHMLVFFINVGILRAILRALCRHSADTSRLKAILVNVTIASGYGFVCFLTGASLGPFALLGAFLIGLLAVHLLCWVAWGRSAVVALIFCILSIALVFGATKGADALFPDRKTFVDAMAEADATLTRLRANESDPINWKWILARALEGIAFFTNPDEADRMTRDISRGMEFYHERKAMLALLEAGEELPEGEPLVFASIDTLATTDLSKVAIDLDAFKEFTGEGSGSEPQEISESLSRIQANLKQGGGMRSLLAMISTGAVSAAELMEDAAAYEEQNPQTAKRVAAIAMIAGKLAGNVSLEAGTGEADAASALDQLLRAHDQQRQPGTMSLLEALAGEGDDVAVKPPGVIRTDRTTFVSAVARPAGLSPGLVTNVAARTNGTMHGATLGTNAVATGGAAELTTTSGVAAAVAPAPPVVDHPSIALLKVAGVLRGGAMTSVLCNDKIVDVGQTVTVTYEGEAFTWELTNVEGDKIEWRLVPPPEEKKTDLITW